MALRTFAYLTLKDRMPLILTQVIDTVNREEKVTAREHGQVSLQIQLSRLLPYVFSKRAFVRTAHVHNSEFNDSAYKRLTMLSSV